ncbi:MAG: Manganese transport system membrane protein MntB [Chlamydiia bacterium]|nr:Manganese transport system membrane protein MntB [Chlamydiia bacterium]
MNDSFFTALASNPFLKMALFAGLLASLGSGIMGSYTVVRRVVFISGSIAHAVLGGIGIAIYLHYYTLNPIFSPLTGAIFSAFFFGFLIGWMHLKYKQRVDSVIAAVWSIGMAIGVILISVTPGSNAELMNFLFGNLLWASHREIYLLGGLNIIIIISSLFLHKRFLAICFDETNAFLQKQPVVLLYFFLLSLICLTIVILIQVIGAILVISMLCLPAAIANIFTRSLSKMIYLAIGLSAIMSLLGTYFSYLFNWPIGATIALITTCFYFLSLPVKQIMVSFPEK